MAKKSKSASAATSLPAFDEDDKSLVHVIIETRSHETPVAFPSPAQISG